MFARIFCCIVCSAWAASGADLKPGGDGVKIGAGTLGDFTLVYPELLGTEGGLIHKRIEAAVEGAAMAVRYEGGAQALVSVGRGEVTVDFHDVPSDVKSWRMTMLIDIGFAKGGKWSAGAASGIFPAEKPKMPQFFSDHATTLRIENAQGQKLSFEVPQFAFQQLTDNREWNWPTYQWQFIVPWNADNPRATVRIASDLQSTQKLIDLLGQPIAASYPAKAGGVEALKEDLAEDARYYSSLNSPRTDRFGGMPGSGEELGLRKTGFFHVETHEGKSWLVDPDGNVYFHLGVCGFAPSDDYTCVKGRESIYEWLPSAKGEFATAFRSENGDENFSFHLANWIRKFGGPYDYESYATRMIERVRKWGFNGVGAFSPTPAKVFQKAHFPYVAHLPINEWQGVPRIPGAFEVWDPFDEATEAKIRENIAREVPNAAQDPLLIGWFIVNEPRFDQLPQAIPALTGKHACKRRLVQFLKEKYQDISAFNAAWELKAADFEALADQGLAVTTTAAKQDVDAFVGLFLETYFSQIAGATKAADPNHLLLGCRLQPITIENEQLCRVMGRSVDVVSYNYYTYGVDTAALRRYHEWSGGKPLMLSEFFWSSPHDSGLIGGREVRSQRERGMAYRNYVEQAAAPGFTVGIEWFTLVDQSATGRWFSKYNGESCNTGLISVADRPWKEMLDEMMTANYGIYEVVCGRRPPFEWDDARFRVDKASKK